MNKPLVLLSIVLGIIFLIIAGVYFAEPAKSLPAFFPGYDAALTKHHNTHGIASLILGIGCFVFAWFQSGNKKTNDTTPPTKAQ